MTTEGASMRARPTIYNGIPMRSRLEARVAAWLDSLGVQWVYEPVAFASPDGQYLPDFELIGSPWLTRWGTRAFLEVKGAFDSRTYFETQERMQIVLASAPRSVLMMADTDMLESGCVELHQADGRWADQYLVSVLVRFGFLSLPQAWCLPGWKA